MRISHLPWEGGDNYRILPQDCGVQVNTWEVLDLDPCRKKPVLFPGQPGSGSVVLVCTHHAGLPNWSLHVVGFMWGPFPGVVSTNVVVFVFLTPFCHQLVIVSHLFFLRQVASNQASNDPFEAFRFHST